MPANTASPVGLSATDMAPTAQGLTLVHFSAQLEPCVTHINTLHTLNTPQHSLNTGYTTPTRTPYPTKSAQVEPRSERVYAPATAPSASNTTAGLGSSTFVPLASPRPPPPPPPPPPPLPPPLRRQTRTSASPEWDGHAPPAARQGLTLVHVRLNLSALYGIGDARRGCVARVNGVLTGVQGV